uniref:Hypoxanthine phosphoribosyltransferase n=1 Tax=mine drainage metagenome TaxID=410659 RepID=E6QQ05_9ZZZZ
MRPEDNAVDGIKKATELTSNALTPILTRPTRTMNPEHAQQILDTADLICDAETVNEAIHQLAIRITADYQHRFPLMLTVMNGGMMFAGQLLLQLNFPLQCDHIHVSRYRMNTKGGQLEWLSMPSVSISGQQVLLLDDILDEGHTLNAIKQELFKMGAATVACAVLTEKLTNTIKPIQAEYVGLTLPNRFVFGCGMDINGVWRNLPAIYAIPQDNTQTDH